MRFGSILAFAAIAPMLAAAEQPVRLQPSSPWMLNYDDESCQLVRTFGEGRDKSTLLLESSAPGEISMLTIGRYFKADVDRDDPGAHFIPVQRGSFHGRPAQTAQSGNPAILWPSVPLTAVIEANPTLPRSPAEAIAWARAHPPARVRPAPTTLAKQAWEQKEREDFATNARALEIEPRAGHPVILETGAIGDPIKLFDQCDRDLLSSWGVDPNIEDKIVRRVWAPDSARWFTSQDYPLNSVLRGDQSEVTVRLLVDATGKVTKCTALTHVDAPEFKKVVCDAFMKRARFQPAELADGTKVPSYWTQHIGFRLE